MIADSLVEQDYAWLLHEGAHDVNPDEFNNMVNYAMAEGIGEEAARKAALDVLLGE